MSRDQKKAESRKRILEAAQDVFFRDGFMSANLDEMAEKAGVAKGTLYRYFESKADLYVAVLTNNHEIFLEQMRAAGQQGDTGLERVRSIARFYFAHWMDHPDYFLIFWAVDNESVIGELPKEELEKISEFWERNLNVIHEALVYGVERGEFVRCDTWEVATMLWSVADSLIESDNTRARRQIRRRPLEPLFMHAVDVIIRGILVDPSVVVLAPPAEEKKSTLVKQG